MNKYMVFLYNEKKPEVVEADKFTIEHPILSFFTGEKLTAAFSSWIGLKELPEKSETGSQSA